jgi:hypothetical protein
MRGAIPPLPNTSSWRGAYLSKRYVLTVWRLVKHRDNFTSERLGLGIPFTSSLIRELKFLSAVTDGAT